MFLAMNEIKLPQGTVRYRESGSGDQTVVLLHGLLVDGQLWRKVVPHLEGEYRVIVPDLPLGVHAVPLNEDADRSPTGMAQLIADFLEALDLHDVTLVGNDSGGGLCQLVAVAHPERVGRLVLTPCDAFEIFPPALFKPMVWSARVPGALTAFLQPMRLRPLRRLPIAFGWLAKRPIDHAVTDSWVKAFLADRGVRRDVVGFLKGSSPKLLIQAGAKLPGFDKPVLVAWAPDDRFFKWELGERLAAAFPDARMVRIEDSYAFVPEDQPERTAEVIRDFVRATAVRSGGERSEPVAT